MPAARRHTTLATAAAAAAMRIRSTRVKSWLLLLRCYCPLINYHKTDHRPTPGGHRALACSFIQAVRALTVIVLSFGTIRNGVRRWHTAGGCSTAAAATAKAAATAADVAPARADTSPIAASVDAVPTWDSAMASPAAALLPRVVASHQLTPAIWASSPDF